jgi:hypothetical protein
MGVSSVGAAARRRHAPLVMTNPNDSKLTKQFA